MNVLELFAGVGGFRVGLENADSSFYKTKWANQFEPSRKRQDAYEIYNLHFPNSENSNIDIQKLPDSYFQNMNPDLIVGGFPCQDYSVARSTHNELGIKGKKGVLFWQIIRATRITKPKYLILENVDRLLKAPAKQRGRDFAIMLSSFNKLGYSVEWRVINAADYGGRQRRRRTYIFVFRNDLLSIEDSFDNYIYKKGLFANAFPVEYIVSKNKINSGTLSQDINDVFANFKGDFYNSGFMHDGEFLTIETISNSNKSPIPLNNTIQKSVDEKYYITDKSKLAKFAYLRGSKHIERVTKDGHKYIYSEGAMSPYDSLDLPSRTMLTSEGNVSRTTHLLKINNRYRVLTPIEAERLQSFPDDWTKYKADGVQVSDRMRMFLMGNALVTDIIKQIGLELKKIDKNV